MSLAALTSGGKDSLYSLYLAALMGFEIPYLVTIVPRSRESYMYHSPSPNIPEMQAEALGVPIILKETAGKKEEELDDLETALGSIRGEVDGVIAGAIASEYQKSRIEGLCSRLELDLLAPIWGIDPKELWEGLLKSGFEVVMTSVAAEGLDGSWLGRTIDEAAFRELEELSERYRFHLGLEGGEGETMVLDMPLFRSRIEVKEARREWDGKSGFYEVVEAGLIPKGTL